MLNQANIVQELKTHKEEFAHNLQATFKENLTQTLQDFNNVGNEENQAPKFSIIQTIYRCIIYFSLNKNKPASQG